MLVFHTYSVQLSLAPPRLFTATHDRHVRRGLTASGLNAHYPSETEGFFGRMINSLYATYVGN